MVTIVAYATAAAIGLTAGGLSVALGGSIVAIVIVGIALSLFHLVRAKGAKNNARDTAQRE
jgi:hypothetical protein